MQASLNPVASHVSGDGTPTLVFVHGFGCAHDDWALQIAALSSEFRCVALDLPGHGASAPPEETSLAALAAAVNMVRAQVRARDVILIGHSMGAKIVREAALQDPHGINGIVLVEGSLYLGERDELVARSAQKVDEGGFRAFAHGLFEEMFVAASDPLSKARLIERAEAMDPEFGRSLFLASVAWDPMRGKASLEQISVPLLLLQSTYFDADFIRRPIAPGGSASFIDLVSTLVPGSEAIVIPAAGHFPMLDAPDVVTDHIGAFARRVAAEGRASGTASKRGEIR